MRGQRDQRFPVLGPHMPQPADPDLQPLQPLEQYGIGDQFMAAVASVNKVDTLMADGTSIRVPHPAAMLRNAARIVTKVVRAAD